MRWPIKSGKQLADGRYVLGIRSHDISPVLNGRDAVSIEGQVLITEISGAESIIHFAHGPLSWISQSHGVHAIGVGETVKFHINTDHCMYFSTDGKLIAS